MKGETPELTPHEVQVLLDRGDIQILDVRTPAEFKGGHIDGAVSVPIGKLEDAADELPLDPTMPVVAVCLTAHRSIGAVRLLKRKGYDVVQLQGGMRAWRKADLPEKTGKPTN
ncbi:MAG: rhodanese-like domain-containing protein [Nannocystaceae bacterium]|nr:rhodanese-like domain-containing protein [Nannocystaceae bacterium]